MVKYRITKEQGKTRHIEEKRYPTITARVTVGTASNNGDDRLHECHRVRPLQITLFYSTRKQRIKKRISTSNSRRRFGHTNDVELPGIAFISSSNYPKLGAWAEPIPPDAPFGFPKKYLEKIKKRFQKKRHAGRKKLTVKKELQRRERFKVLQEKNLQEM